jgi:hypothetical protein
VDLIEFDLALRQRLGLIRLLVRVEDVHILKDRVLVAERLHTPSFLAIVHKNPRVLHVFLSKIRVCVLKFTTSSLPALLYFGWQRGTEGGVSGKLLRRSAIPPVSSQRATIPEPLRTRYDTRIRRLRTARPWEGGASGNGP